jgi:maltose O-acetyltransferase
MAEKSEKTDPGTGKFQHDRMMSGKLYVADDGPELVREGARKYRILNAIRALPLGDPGRQKLYAELFKSWGEGSYIESPFYCDYGSHISVGKYFYANAGCVFLDPAPITIGDWVFLGPSVGIYTPFHPIAADVRRHELEGAKAITIGSDVWIGGNAVICPGVTIGSNVVIGAGSVVTKDIPDGCVAVGNPCHVLRPITDQDEKYWHQQAEEYFAAQRQYLDRQESTSTTDRPDHPDHPDTAE